MTYTPTSLHEWLFEDCAMVVNPAFHAGLDGQPRYIVLGPKRFQAQPIGTANTVHGVHQVIEGFLQRLAQEPQPGEFLADPEAGA